MSPGQQWIGSGSHCPAALSSVYSAAPQSSAGELRLLTAAETVGPQTKPSPPSDEPDRHRRTAGRVRGGDTSGCLN